MFRPRPSVLLSVKRFTVCADLAERGSVSRYVFRVFAEFLPLPARDERGEGRGGGSPRLTWRCASSPRPSPPAGEEREKSQRRTAKHILSRRDIPANLKLD